MFKLSSVVAILLVCVAASQPAFAADNEPALRGLAAENEAVAELRNTANSTIFMPEKYVKPPSLVFEPAFAVIVSTRLRRRGEKQSSRKTRAIEMDEIALLQQQLAAVQQQESALKLSDHNVIDLLMKLQQLGKIQVVHTLTGKQFLTPTQIEREIQDYVTLNAGRISMTELQQLINIDRSYVEKYVAQLVRNKKSSGGSSYFVVNSGEEVVTSWYLDAIMEDTNTLLQETGTCTIGDLAQQYGFAVEYMKDVVFSRIGSILQAQERNNVLYTHSFVESQKAQIRGVFSAITRPTFVPDIVRTYHFEEKVLEEYLQELMQKRVLMGTIRGREYVPYVFIEAQRESMYSFFQQNGYLDHARALQLQVTRPYEFLKRRFPDAIPLKDCVVSQALYLQVEGSIEAAVNEASFVDLRTVLPSAVQSSDVAILLTKSPSLARGANVAFQVNEVFAVSKAFFDNAVEKLKQDASAKALKASSQQQRLVVSAATQKMSSAGSQFDDDDGDDSGDDFGGKRGGKRGKKASKAAAAVEESVPDKKSKRGGGKGSKNADDAAALGKGKGGKGKKGKKGDDAAAGVGSNATSKRSNASGSSSSASVSITPSREELFELLVSWFPQVEDDEELLDGVAGHLESQIDAIYTTALNASLSSIIRGDAASLRELRKKFEDKFDDLLSLLFVYEKGFNKLEINVNAKNKPDMEQLKVVESHILASAGVELASLVTSFVAESNSLEMDGVPPFTESNDAKIVEEYQDSKMGSAPASSITTKTTTMTSLSDENKKALESNLPAATAREIVRLWTFSIAGRRSLSDFMLHIPVLADALSMPLRKMDRKKERQVVFSYRNAVIGELNQVGGENVVATTALLLQLFFQQSTGFPATFPKDSVSFGGMVLNAFRASIPEAPMAKLDALVALAQELSESGDAADAQEHGWPALVDEVHGLVLAKDISSA